MGKVFQGGNGKMKIEYDPVRDLLYIWFGLPGERAAKTETVVPGVHADFDKEGRLLGIEVLDASEVLRHKVQFEVELAPSSAKPVPA
jgi:uncharacterized protein YuzE